MIVTLLTDFGFEDEYVGAMKGVILSINRSAHIIDISHQVPPGDVEQASWRILWSWKFFPEKTVHVIVVDPGVGSKRRILCLDLAGHLFLGPDNGVLSRLTASSRKWRLYEVSNRRYALPSVSHTFHGRDIFAPVAGHLSKGVSPSKLGHRVAAFQRLPFSIPRFYSGRVVGKVISIDHFGNAVTNISAEVLAKCSHFLEKKGRVWIGKKRIGPLRISYAAVRKGAGVALIGSRGLLEVAVNGGSAASLFKVSVGDEVQVRG
ncbi:MAG: SAM-dependent chlorinase/fluorinase [Candidatus Omnitrophica bacterium]|nr:SAM-dependent chlorinase/fluorinase [Candidatus Omnitrophota bacterium]